MRSVHLGAGRRLTGLGLRPEQVALDQRRRILACATHACALHGYRAATVRHLIEAAGVSRRTFYELFDDKARACLEAHVGALAGLTARLAGNAVLGGWPERVARGIGEALVFARDSPGQATLLAQLGFACGPWGPQVDDQLLVRFAPGLRLGRRYAPGLLPATLEQALLSRLARVVAARLRAGRAEGLPPIAEFVFTPYLGAAQARATAAPPSPPQREGENFRPRSLKDV